MSNALIIFIKNPEIGKPKTRLAADIGDKKALDVYKKLLAHTKKITQDLSCNKYLFYSDFIDNKDNWENTIFRKQQQISGNLGEKIHHAFKTVFQENNNVIIVGSDCYELTTDIINSAFDQLKNNDLVVGPAVDGGYYLLGMNRLNKELFTDIAWSSESVLTTTINKAKRQELSYFLLPTLNDIDTIEDLKKSSLKYN